MTLVFNASDNYNLGRADQRWVVNPVLLVSEATSGFQAEAKGEEQRHFEVPELPCPHIYTHQLWHTIGLSIVQGLVASKANNGTVK